MAEPVQNPASMEDFATNLKVYNDRVKEIARQLSEVQGPQAADTKPAQASGEISPSAQSDVNGFAVHMRTQNPKWIPVEADADFLRKSTGESVQLRHIPGYIPVPAGK